MPASSSLPVWLSEAMTCLATGDIAGWSHIYTDDGIHEFPFAPEGRPKALHGREAISAYMAQLPGFIRFGHLDAIRARETADELIVEARGHHHRVADGTPFDVDYVWIITLQNGKVSRFRDYMNPLQLSRL
ncbi:nuclear transport factor 2 family protein [Frateuria aurantia]